MDDVHVQGQVGYLLQDGMTQVHYYLNTHLHFDIAYNDMPEQGGVYQVSPCEMQCRILLLV